MAILLVAVGAPHGIAAEITVLSTHNIEPALAELKAGFEKASGHRLAIEAQGSAATRNRAARGDAGDVVINSRPILDALVEMGRVRAGRVVDVSHASLGAVVAAGAPHPDIATDEALKRTLMEARSLAWPDPTLGSLGGNVFARLIDDWGIAAPVRAKSRLMPGGLPAGKLVAEGGAAIGINQVAELKGIRGIEFLEPLPPAFRDKVVMAAGILVAAREPEAGMDWINYLASPAAAKALKEIGMDP